MLSSTTSSHYSDSVDTFLGGESSCRSTTSTSKISILGDLPVFNSQNFSKPNPRSNLNPPKLFYAHTKPKYLVNSDRTSLLQRHFEKAHSSANSSISPNLGNNNITTAVIATTTTTTTTSNTTKRNVTDSELSSTPYDRPTKILKN